MKKILTILFMVTLTLPIGLARAEDQKNVGAAATKEQAMEAYQLHEKVRRGLPSQVQEAWSKAREELSKEVDGNEKRREVLGRLFLIAEKGKDDFIPIYTDLFAAAYSTKIEPKNVDRMVENAWQLYVYDRDSRDGLILILVTSGLLEKEFGDKKSDDSIDKFIEAFIAASLGQESLKIKAAK